MYSKLKKKDIKCHGCGKYGHVVRYCTNTCRGGNNGGAQWQGGAYQPQQNRGRGGRGSGQRGRGYGQRGFGQRGGSRDWQQRYNGASQHDANYSNYENYDDQGIDSFLTRVERDDSNDNITVYTSDMQKIDWILDSECSDYIVNDDSYFIEYENLKNPIYVKVGDGKTLKGAKVGKIFTYLEVNKRRIKIIMSNVFYVKEMDNNLVSCARVTNKNKIVSAGNTSKICNKYIKLIGSHSKIMVYIK